MSKKGFNCAWCDTPVMEKGATCDSMCYFSWVAWKLRISQAPPLVILEGQEEPPLDLIDQPWYNKEIWHEDD